MRPREERAHRPPDSAAGSRRRAAVVPDGLRFHDLRHPIITELAEMGGADHVLESISGRLSRRMLEHSSHILIDAKRQALDALDGARRGEAGNGNAANGNGEAANVAEIETVVEVSDDLTSQSRQQFAFAGLAALR